MSDNETDREDMAAATLGNQSSRENPNRLDIPTPPRQPQALTVNQQMMDVLAVHRRLNELEAELTNVRLGQRDQSPRCKPLPQVSFSGGRDEDWLTFKRSFLQAADFYQYNDREGIAALSHCVRGAASRAVEGILIPPRATLDQMIQRYEDRFLPPSASSMAQAKFEKATQDPREDVLQYHARLRTLWVRAYPGHHVDDRILIRKFALGLSSPRVRDAVLRGQAAMYERALELAQCEAAVLETTRPTTGTYEGRPGLHALKKGNPRGYQRGIKWTVEKRDAGRPVRCYYCEKEGHISSECQKKAFDQRAGRGRGRMREDHRRSPSKQRFHPTKKKKRVSTLEGEDEDKWEDADGEGEEEEAPPDAEDDDDEDWDPNYWHDAKDEKEEENPFRGGLTH